MMPTAECGIFGLHPDCLQKFGSVGWFVLFACFTMIGTQSSTLYMSTQITALERQFGFTSSQIGILMVCNDIGFLTVALGIGYIAPKVHIPRSLSLATFTVAVAAFLCTVPYFVAYDHIQEQSFNRLSKLPNVATIEMVRNLQQENMAELSPDKTIESGIQETSTQNTPYLVTLSSNVSQNLPKTTTDGMTTRSPSPVGGNPFLSMLAKLRQYLGDDIYLKLTKEAGIQDDHTLAMPALKRLVKKIATNATLLHMLPAKGRQRVLMFARLSKRSLSKEEGSPGISDLGNLHPFDLMLIIAPRCTAIPKRASNCEMVAKILNKGESNQYTSLAFAVFALSLVLMGVAKSARLPMTLLYLDDNGSKARIPMYAGWLLAVIPFSTMFAFGLGIMASRLYVTMEAVPIHPLNPHWIGAWWLGFLVISAISLLAAMPLVCFPKRLPTASRDKKSSKLPKDNFGRRKKAKVVGKEFLLSLKRCLTNPVLLGLAFCGATVFLLFAGVLPFAPKYMETQFTLPAWKANMFVGITKIIPGLISACVTGALITRLNLSPLAMVKIGLGASLGIVVCGALYYVFGCKTLTIVGFNAHSSGDVGNETRNAWTCASACHCETVDYFPVCGSDGRTYFSACHAGCTGSRDKMFTGCSCVGENGTASLGPCKGETCHMFPAYIVNTSLSTAFLAAVGVIFTLLGLRCVPDRDRSLALAIIPVISNLLGWLPAPIIFGKLVDSACMMWRTTCAHLHKGACTVYDIERFRKLLSGYIVITGVLMVLGMSFVYYKSKNKTDWNWNAKLFDRQPDGVDDDNEGEETPMNDSEITERDG